MPKRGQGWLPEVQWHKVQNQVPIACVDVLVLRKDVTGAVEIGLIFRDTPRQGRRWCLVGGRILRNESLQAAVNRQLFETLGVRARCILQHLVQPLLVAEYFPKHIKGALFDPRQHALGMTFPVWLKGPFEPGGEALDFRWFGSGQLPNSAKFGFGQRKIVLECIRRINDQPNMGRSIESRSTARNRRPSPADEG